MDVIEGLKFLGKFKKKNWGESGGGGESGGEGVRWGGGRVGGGPGWM